MYYVVIHDAYLESQVLPRNPCEFSTLTSQFSMFCGANYRRHSERAGDGKHPTRSLVTSRRFTPPGIRAAYTFGCINNKGRAAQKRER